MQYTVDQFLKNSKYICLSTLLFVIFQFLQYKNICNKETQLNSLSQILKLSFTDYFIVYLLICYVIHWC